MSADRFDGVVAVLVTPYRRGVLEVDEDQATRLAGRLDSAGIPVLTALGNTAEVQQLDDAERLAVLRAVAGGRRDALLVAGAAGGAGAVLRETERARSLGYDAAMIHEPADPFGDGSGLARYYSDIAERSALPLVLYLRSTRLKEEALADLVQHPKVAAVKYAREDLFTLAALLRGPAGTACSWVNGLAETRVPAFAALGVTGFTSGIANARPEMALEVHRAAKAGDLPRLRELIELFAGPVEAVRAEGNSRYNVAALKQLMRWEGIETGGVRAPHSPLDEPAAARLQDALDRWRRAAVSAR